MFNVSVRKIVVSTLAIAAPIAFSVGASTEAWGGHKITDWNKTGGHSQQARITDWNKTTPKHTAIKITDWNKRITDWN